MRTQLLKHLVPVRARLHVDEVDDDDAADIAQPDLACHLACRFDVRAQDGALGIALAGITSRIHIDRDERFRRLDDQVAAGRQFHALLEEIADLRLDVVGVEERSLILIEFDARDQLGIDLLQVLFDFVVEHLGVNEQQVDFVRQQVAHDPASKAGLPLHQRRGVPGGRFPFDLLPETEQVVDLAFAARFRQVIGHRPDDPTARIGWDEFGD